MSGRRLKVLYIGRFQPFHKGHLEVIRSLGPPFKLDIVVGIGCPMDGQTFRNPFTFEERKLMLVSALVEARMKVHDIVRINDINDEPHWVEHVHRCVGHYDIVYTNSRDAVLFKKAGDIVIGEGKQMFSRKLYRATRIRELMASGNMDWERLVPPSVRKILVDLDAEKRLALLWQEASRKCPDCGGELDRCPEGHALCFGCGWQCDGCDWDGV